MYTEPGSLIQHSRLGIHSLKTVLRIHSILMWIRIRILDPHWKKMDLYPEMEFKEFEPRFKSAKTRFKLRADLNLETFDTILSGSNHI